MDAIEAAAIAIEEHHSLLGYDAYRMARAAIAAYRDAEIERLTAELEKKDDHFMNSQLREHIVTLCDENDALRAKLEAAERNAAAVREHVRGCVDAAYAEGLAERLAEQEMDVGNLRDLVERRLLHVTDFDAAIDAARGGERG